MQELDFFYKQLDEKEAIKELNSFKAKITSLDYQLKNHIGGNIRNLIICHDHSAYSFEEFDFGDPVSFAEGWVKQSFSCIENIQLKYSLWTKKSFPTTLSTPDLVADNLIRYSEDLESLPEILQPVFRDLIIDYTLKLIQYFPDSLDKNYFYYLVKTNIAPMLPNKAIDLLSKIYDFNYKGISVTSSISKKEWVDFFISGIIPHAKIKLNFNTKSSSDIFEYLSNTYNLNKRQFYISIENSGVVFTKSGSVLSYRNIAKSNSDFTPNAIKFREAFKKHFQ